MNINKTSIEGMLIIEPRLFRDARGYFFESFSEREFEEKVSPILGHSVHFCQDNENMSIYGVMRGLHFQRPPYTQSKLVRCVKGRVLDVAVDIRKKMGKKVSSVKSYSCAMPMFKDIRKLNYKGQAKVCKTFHQYLKKNPNVVSFLTDRFEETYSRIDMKDLEESVESIGYALNDMDNAISEIDYNDPMTFFDIEKSMGKVISKELKINSLK